MSSNRRTDLKRVRLSSVGEDNDDVNVDSGGVMMSTINATINMASNTENMEETDGVNLSQERVMSDVAVVENSSPVAVQVTDPCLHAPPSSARLNVVERRDSSTDPSLPSSSRDPNLMAGRDADLYVTDALLKFLMCRSNKYLPVDFIKDPNFRIFLERACQYGVPSSLVRGESPVIERSLMNFKDTVYQHISTVEESWKTNGCTMMVYNLNQRKAKISTLEKGNNVLGFYCPKGFFFFEEPSLSDIDDALTRRSSYNCPVAYYGDVLNCIIHDDDEYQFCELSAEKITDDWDDWGAPEMEGKVSCLRHQIQMLCTKMCDGSEWAEGLFNKASKIHQYIATDSLWCDRYYKTLRKKKFKEFDNGMHQTSLSRFLSIMLLEDDLKMWTSNPIRYTRQNTHRNEDHAEVKATVNDSEFWVNGRALQKALNLILQIRDLMDTLVPSIGYVKLAIDKARRELNSCNRPRTSTVDQFWHDLDLKLSQLHNQRIEIAAYLNPVYFFGQVVGGHCFDLDPNLEYELSLILTREEKEVMEQLQRYSLISSNPFASISNDERQNTHPIKLWGKYGHGFPVLQKWAIKFLSQPASCMCNQVKKHMSQLEGADDLILRLNARMIEEFANLGDNIYKPIDLEQIVYNYW